MTTPARDLREISDGELADALSKHASGGRSQYDYDVMVEAARRLREARAGLERAELRGAERMREQAVRQVQVLRLSLRDAEHDAGLYNKTLGNNMAVDNSVKLIRAIDLTSLNPAAKGDSDG